MGRVPKVYICAHENCSAKFKRLDKLTCHQRTHTGERPFICLFDDCNKSYTRLSHLKRHEESHEGNFRCTVADCSEVLKTKAYLRNHLDNVHGQKKHKTYKCSLCDKEFNKHSWLQRHMFRHTGQLPHVCPVEDCKREFLLPSRLKRHMRYHRGYPCGKPNCDQVFPKWSFLVKHVKESHPTVYKCDTCGKIFSGWSNLKQHKLVHQDEREVFACEVPNCSRFYTLKRNLVHHVKYYHGRHPFVCTREHCHRAFMTQELLDDHILHHDSKKPKRKKKKKPKPTFAAKLSGCAPPKVINRKPASTSESSNSPLPKVQDEELVKNEHNLSDYVTITFTMTNDDLFCSGGSESKSSLAIFEDILNSTYVPVDQET